ncbi:unnamed protein product [marine sediment metagenome]|uniref:Uncharacterized protein n=1 Tax=marine sediment metagenome TaxID=412755 RepID=X0VNR4_9ZZZZ
MVPYNPNFCAYRECTHLVHRGLCDLEECIYNLKWIKYWEAHGVYPPNKEE